MLTRKQHELLLFIQDRLESRGVSPSFDEMKDALGLKSKSGVHRLITALEERGFLRRLPHRARALEVLKLPDAAAGRAATPSAPPSASGPLGGIPANDPGQTAVEVPLHGQIAAGTPVEAIERPDSMIAVPPEMVGPGAHFALTISGDSMVEKGILNGDTVVIQSCDAARDGEIVVALVDSEEATLKTLDRRGAQVALVPANRDHETQLLDAGRVKIQGRLVGLLRRYH